jgi:hypothetical protein
MMMDTASSSSTRSRAATIEDLDKLGHALACELGVYAFLVGGSTIYKAIEANAIFAARDFDTVILMKTRTSMFNLIRDNHSRGKLFRLFGISGTECEALPLHCADAEIQAHVDAIRVAGISADGRKVSVKVLNVEHFECPQSETLRILSCKDRRVYELNRDQERICFRLQQVRDLVYVDSNIVDHCP